MSLSSWYKPSDEFASAYALSLRAKYAPSDEFSTGASYPLESGPICGRGSAGGLGGTKYLGTKSGLFVERRRMISSASFNTSSFSDFVGSKITSNDICNMRVSQTTVMEF